MKGTRLNNLKLLVNSFHPDTKTCQSELNRTHSDSETLQRTPDGVHTTHRDQHTCVRTTDSELFPLVCADGHQWSIIPSQLLQKSLMLRNKRPFELSSELGRNQKASCCTYPNALQLQDQLQVPSLTLRAATEIHWAALLGSGRCWLKKKTSQNRALWSCLQFQEGNTALVFGPEVIITLKVWGLGVPLPILWKDERNLWALQNLCTNKLCWLPQTVEFLHITKITSL